MRRVWKPFHQKPRSRRRNWVFETLPDKSPGKPSDSTWKRTSTGTSAILSCLPRSLATTCVPLRPVPPTNSTGGGLATGRPSSFRRTVGRLAVSFGDMRGRKLVEGASAVGCAGPAGGPVSLDDVVVEEALAGVVELRCLR